MPPKANASEVPSRRPGRPRGSGLGRPPRVADPDRGERIPKSYRFRPAFLAQLAELQAHYGRLSPTSTTEVSVLERAVAELHERELGERNNFR